MSVARTERCQIEALNASHKDDILKLYTNPKTREFLGGVIATGDFDAKFENDILHCGHNFVVQLKDSGTFIGLINIDDHHDGEYQEISYQFLPEYWGHGLAQESLNAMLDYAHLTLRLKEIISETQVRNTQSAMLLERLGMKPIKTLERFGNQQTIYYKEL